MSLLLNDWLMQVVPSFPDPDSAQYEARLLAQHITQQTPVQQRLHPYTLSKAQQQQLNHLAQRRAQGEPIAYLLGWQPFYNLKLRVSPATLIPRGDTEFVVDILLEHLRPYSAPHILDLGTGSGAIALALANQRPDATIIASDNSPEALTIAQANAQHHHLHNVHFIASHWLDGFANQQSDLIVSNPPYIAADDAHLADLQHEPQSALVAADNGLSELTHLIFHAARVLKPKGHLFLEHGYNQTTAIRQLAQQSQHWHYRQTHIDYGNQPRLTHLQRIT